MSNFIINKLNLLLLLFLTGFPVLLFYAMNKVLFYFLKGRNKFNENNFNIVALFSNIVCFLMVIVCVPNGIIGLFNNGGYSHDKKFNDWLSNTTFDANYNVLNINDVDDNLIKYKIKTGIDVSKYQEEIDWKIVSENNIDFAMIRLGYRGNEIGGLYLDEFYNDNLHHSLSTDLDIGCYFVSTAISEKEVEEEAGFVLENIKNFNITMPIAIAWGQEEFPDSRTYGISKERACKLMECFCSLIENAGYEPLIYLKENWLDDFQYDFKYSLWISAYGRKEKPDINGLKMWQYTDSGEVSGISGKVVLDYYFND